MIHLNLEKLFLCYRHLFFMAPSLCHSLVRQTFMQQALIIISILLFSLYSLLLIYYRQAWNALPNLQSYPERSRRATSNLILSGVEGQSPTRITIIIPARNEAQNIKACLDSMISQSYSKDLFEVLVVDDHSTDKTAEIGRAHV